jgi:Cu(I)/Ag(I) efflux system protein CusF
MKKPIIAIFMLAVGTFSWFLLPTPPPLEPAAGGHASHGGDPAALSDGVVVSIDRSGGNITISHGPIPHLGMSGMTMGFRAAEPGLLEEIKPGDKVRFHADIVDGKFTAMTIERVN